MNKTAIYLLLFFAIALAAWFGINSIDTNTLNKTTAAFALTDTAAVTKIIIEDNEGRKLQLDRKNGWWQVNRGYKARPDAVERVLMTLIKLQVKYPIGKDAYESTMKNFEDPIRRVSIFKEDSTQASKVYLLGGAPHTRKGTYMMLEGTEDPYVVHLLGHDGHLMTRFFTIPETWRDRMLMNYKASDIAGVKVEYPHFEESSFELKAIADSFEVESLGGKVAIAASEKLNKPVTIQFLKSFENVYLEGFENSYPHIDSVRASKPFAILTITPKKGKEQKLTVHYMPINRRSKLQVDENGRDVPFDVDRFFAFINDGKDFVLIQRRSFEGIFKRLEHFYYTPVVE
ncbi:MAG: DUF4340 domain-containing protein [Chitinophagales bacterium]